MEEEIIWLIYNALFLGEVLKTARLTDFGVVPVFGSNVKVSVAEIVTNAWLVSVCVCVCEA